MAPPRSDRYCSACQDTTTHALHSKGKGRGQRWVCLACHRGRAQLRHERSPLASTWRGMVTRCTNPNAPAWENYGGRGIRVSPLWLGWPTGYEAWMRYMGPRPEGYTVERVNNNGHYEPGNVCWATPTEQARNRRGNTVLVLEGRSQTLGEWLEEKGINRATYYSRLKQGWTRADAVLTPANPYRKILTAVHQGVTRSLMLVEWAQLLGVHRRSLEKRLAKGWSFRQVVATPFDGKRRPVVVDVALDGFV